MKVGFWEEVILKVTQNQKIRPLSTAFMVYILFLRKSYKQNGTLTLDLRVMKSAIVFIYNVLECINQLIFE